MAWRVITRYRPDRGGMAEIATGRELRIACVAIATKAKAYAQVIAPDGFQNYELQFDVEDDVIPDIPFRKRGEPMERVAAILINQSPLAVLVEVGSAKSEEYRIMRSTLRWIETQGKAGG